MRAGHVPVALHCIWLGMTGRAISSPPWRAAVIDMKFAMLDDLNHFEVCDSLADPHSVLSQMALRQGLSAA
jgi:hypothetical protein